MYNKKHFLIASILVVAFLCAPGIAAAFSVNDTFTDIISQGLDPGNFTNVHEHGGPGASWAATDEGVSVVWTYGFGGGNTLKVDITNTSSHTMGHTMLAFEQNAYDWKGTVLAANSWDGVDGSNDAAYVFGNIASGATASRQISLMAGYASPNLAYDSMGLDTISESPGASNVSITAAPEPVSSTLFLVGAATLGFRRFRKRRLG